MSESMRLILPGYNRFASLVITAFGAIANFVLAIQLLAAWRSLKWEPESEWEASGDTWRVDGVKVIWVLLSTYFASAATVCIVGFSGIIKKKPSFVRFYRDYSIADFSFCTFVTVVTTYAVFHTSARAAICEELSHHPELMRDTADMGLNLENCERWLEHAALGFVALMVIVTVVRLHFLLAVSNLYSQLIRQQQGAVSHARGHTHFRYEDSDSLRKIFILSPNQQSTPDHGAMELVYAPVPISSLPENLRSSATEAWVSEGGARPWGKGRHSRTSSDVSQTYHRGRDQPLGHHRRHSHGHFQHRHQSSRSRSSTRTGAICLPVLPDEGLFPQYGDVDSKV